MERLYTILHEVSQPTHRKGILRADLSFLTSGIPAVHAPQAVSPPGNA
jgi:hypothetical protein